MKSLTKIFRDAGFSKTFVMASVGHITEIKDGGNYWNTGIEPSEEFKANYVVSKDKKEVVDNLKGQVKVADKVYICSDPDREGEAIAWSLQKFLGIPKDKYERVTFHEITPTAVIKAFDNPRKIDKDLVAAAQSRQKLDKIVGYRLSPIAKTSVNAKSVGRCQSAGLKLIVDREKEIINFVPETYWELYLYFNKNNNEFKAKYVGTPTQEMKRIPSEEEVERIIDECKKNKPFKVTNIETKERYSNPKPPFTTSTFQQEVISKLGLSTKISMQIAQKLFEGIDVGGEHIGLITYIRTDSPELAPEFLPELEKHVKKTYGNDYYSPVRKAKKSENAQDGHEAIRPVDMNMTPERLSSYVHDDLLLKVYKIIYKRTEACAMVPSVTSETTYTISAKDHMFNLVSRELLFDGYKRAYNYKEDNEEKDITTDTFEKDEIINATALESEEKSTTPPARYKESTFIKELEKQGIGRPSTFATIVETILSESRGYCELEDGYICPTALGMRLSEFLDKEFNDVISIQYTSEMEKDLDLIAEGKLNDVEFLTNFHNNLEKQADKVESSSSNKVCPQCGGTLVRRKGPYGYFLGCSNYPECKYLERIPGYESKPTKVESKPKKKSTAKKTTKKKSRK